ncbi:hypothetical protein [Pseudoalteromonas sp. M8]|uniref:hypothetical protein n=1 Tax=Pseudoalteromonas sp. M8 TaxID=2692624 RepID=UPI001BAB60CD|nr:hypothetical protein [Pseudoalteromonas sp. M8]QUI68902.1 hypothetical protein GSF13_03605 [Pseudoalteromonas sp. M8]
MHIGLVKVFFVLATLTSLAVYAVSYDEITDIDALAAHFDEPTFEQHFLEEDMEFIWLYFKDIDHSFLVNTETGEVCHHFKGKKRESCFPASYFE